MTSSSTPRVLLIDPESWDAFVSLASALQHHGVGVAHVTTKHVGATAAVNRVLRRVAFGSTEVHLEAHDFVAQLDRVQPLCDEPTIDIQGPEREAHQMRSAGVWSLTTVARRVPPEVDWQLLYDKWAMSEFAARHSIPVPQAWTDAPDELPVVVKGKTGSGGGAVRVVTTADERLRAAEDMDPHHSGDVFFQRFVAGDSLTFGGVARDGRIVSGAAYRMIPSADDPLGPAATIELVDVPSIDSGIAALITALGYSGFFCADYVAPASGDALLIDFNPRVFGGWLAMQQAGVDLLGAYLHVLGCGPEPLVESRVAGARENVRVLPRDSASDWADLPQQSRLAVHAIRRAVPITGWRFGAVSSVGSALLLARETGRLIARTFR